jgi:plasmid stabilization system protein ParE
MPAIYKRPLAQEDLIEIWEYIADDSIDRADAFIDIVDDKLRTLAVQPMMGHARDELMAGFVAFLSAVTYCFTNGLRMALPWCAHCMVPATFPLNSKASDTAGELATSCSPSH